MSPQDEDNQRLGDGDSTIDERPMVVSSWEGRIVDERYRVLEQIGEGGMGTVYVAEHLTLHKQVAFKTILPKYARDGDVSARFEREAMATGRLDHPNVASAMDFGSLPDGGAYLVMQLVRGRSVEEKLIASGAMSWPRVCSIAAQVADALYAAHKAGIVHRDLKPENVMVETREDGSELALVLDFGIAQIHGQAELLGTARTEQAPLTAGRQITRVGAVVGTPGYMAPEQALGEKTDHRTDLYSLGVLLWEMVTGRTLFDADDITEIVTAQIAAQPSERIVAVTGDETIPDELQQLIDTLLSRKPDNRPGSAAEVRDTLRELTLRAATSSDGRISLGRLTPVHGVQSGRATPTKAPKIDPADLRGKAELSGRTIALIVLTALVLTGVVVGTIAALRPTEEATAPTDPELLQAIYEEARQANRAEELARQCDIMMHDDDGDVRHQAALFVLDFEPADQVEGYLRDIAQLETAQGCAEYREALEAALIAPDVRVRPVVERMESANRCRRRGRRVHCYACVRRLIRRFLERTEPEEPVDGEGAEAPTEAVPE